MQKIKAKNNQTKKNNNNHNNKSVIKHIKFKKLREPGKTQ